MTAAPTPLAGSPGLSPAPAHGSTPLPQRSQRTAPEADTPPEPGAPLQRRPQTRRPVRPKNRRLAQLARLRQPAVTAPLLTPTSSLTPAAPVAAATPIARMPQPRSWNALAVGTDAGSAPLVRLFDARTQQERGRFLATDRDFTGGVRVAVGDVNGDGNPDVLTGLGQGGGSRVRVFDGRTGEPFSGTLGGLDAFAPGQSDGVFVALGDVDGDGRDDLIVGTDGDAAPLVRVFSGHDGSLLAEYAVPALGESGGVRVTAGDLTDDGRADLVLGSGAGNVPRVVVLDGSNGAEVYNFFPSGLGSRVGVYVAAGDVDGDGIADILTGAGEGERPEMQLFSGRDSASRLHVTAFEEPFRGGVRVSLADVDGNGRPELVAAQGSGGNRVGVYSASNGAALSDWGPNGRRHENGLFVGGDASPGSEFQGGGVAAMTSSEVTLRVTRTTLREGGDFVHVWATRTGDMESEPVIPVTLSGSATLDEDYFVSYGNLEVNFGAMVGEVGVGFELMTVSDMEWEGIETIVVTLEPGSGYTLVNPSITIQILDGDGPPVTVPDESVYCPCAVGPLPQVPNGASGNNPSGVSSGGVRLFDGTLRLNMADLTSSGFGLPWGMSRSWTHSPGYEGGSSAGSGQVVADLPYLRSDLTGDTLALITDGTSARFFDLVGSDYEGRFYLQDQLVHDSMAGIFTLTDPSGNVMTFHDFASSYPGAFQSYTDVGGNVTEVISRDGGGRPTEV